MDTVRVNLGPRAYDIRIAHADPPGLGPFARSCAPDARLALVACDGNTTAHAAAARDALESAGFRVAVTVVPAGEPTKSLVHLSSLYDALADLPADRRTLVVAVGGGVVGDLAGFAAATYNRGLPLLMVPTTLLAMVDSSVGGKTGINHPTGKNLIGAFHQPAGVWIDTATLATLPDREFRSGLAEVVKYGVALDADFFSSLRAKREAVSFAEPDALRFVVKRSCELKAQVVEQDEREETGLRAVLNFGHTFAHAFEAVAGYGTWLHGEAVAAGMVSAAKLAGRRGMVNGGFLDRLVTMLEGFGLPTAPDPAWDVDALLAAMRRDKKATAAGLRFVLPTRLGHVELVDGVPEGLVREVLTQR